MPSAAACHSESTRAPLDQQPRDVPAAVADGVVQRAAAGDRGARRLDVGAAIDQDGRDLDVVAARGPVQRRL
jgi:hypothetical protein